MEDDPSFIKKVLWTDECKFQNNGILNRQNSRYWSDKNPCWMRESNFQVMWSTNVWCGIVGETLLGPYFFEGINFLDKILNS